jgi:hypothetical protein
MAQPFGVYMTSTSQEPFGWLCSCQKCSATAPAPPAAPLKPAATVEADSGPGELPESSGDQDPTGGGEPVQSGQQPRTREEARAAVRALLGEDLTDREITRRVGVLPSTVAAVRESNT